MMTGPLNMHCQYWATQQIQLAPWCHGNHYGFFPLWLFVLAPCWWEEYRLGMHDEGPVQIHPKASRDFWGRGGDVQIMEGSSKYSGGRIEVGAILPPWIRETDRRWSSSKHRTCQMSIGFANALLVGSNIWTQQPPLLVISLKLYI